MLNPSGEAHSPRFVVTRPTALPTVVTLPPLLLPHVLTNEAWRCDKRSLGCWSAHDSAINTSSMHAGTCCSPADTWLTYAVGGCFKRYIMARPPRLMSLASRTPSPSCQKPCRSKICSPSTFSQMLGRHVYRTLSMSDGVMVTVARPSPLCTV